MRGIGFQCRTVLLDGFWAGFAANAALYFYIDLFYRVILLGI